MDYQPGPYVSAITAKNVMRRELEHHSPHQGHELYVANPHIRFNSEVFRSSNKLGKGTHDLEHPFHTTRVNHEIILPTNNSPRRIHTHMASRRVLPKSIWPGDLESSDDLHYLWSPFSPLPVLLSECIVEMAWQEKYFQLMEVYLENADIEHTGGMDFKQFQAVLSRYPCIERAYIRDLFTFIDCQRHGIIQEADFISGFLVCSPEAPHLYLPMKISPNPTLCMIERTTGLRPSALIRLQLIFLTFDADGDAVLNIKELAQLLTRVLSILCSEKRMGRMRLEEYSKEAWDQRLGEHFWSIVSKQFYNDSAYRKSRSLNFSPQRSFRRDSRTIHNNRKPYRWNTFTAPSTTNIGEFMATSLKRIFGFVDNEDNNLPDVSPSNPSHTQVASYSHLKNALQQGQHTFYASRTNENAVLTKPLDTVDPSSTGYLPRKSPQHTSVETKPTAVMKFDAPLHTQSSNRNSVAPPSPHLCTQWSTGNGVENTSSACTIEPLTRASRRSSFGTAQGDLVSPRNLTRDIISDKPVTSPWYNTSQASSLHDDPHRPLESKRPFTNDSNGSLRDDHIALPHLSSYSDRNGQPGNTKHTVYTPLSIKRNINEMPSTNKPQGLHQEDITFTPDIHITSMNHYKEPDATVQRALFRAEASHNAYCSSTPTCLDDLILQDNSENLNTYRPGAHDSQLEDKMSMLYDNVYYSHDQRNPKKGKKTGEKGGLGRDRDIAVDCIGKPRRRENDPVHESMIENTYSVQSDLDITPQGSVHNSTLGSKCPKMSEIDNESLYSWGHQLTLRLAQHLAEVYDAFGDCRGLCFSMFVEAVRNNDIPGTSVLLRTRQDICSVIKKKKDGCVVSESIKDSNGETKTSKIKMDITERLRNVGHSHVSNVQHKMYDTLNSTRRRSCNEIATPGDDDALHPKRAVSTHQLSQEHILRSEYSESPAETLSCYTRPLTSSDIRNKCCAEDGMERRGITPVDTSQSSPHWNGSISSENLPQHTLELSNEYQIPTLELRRTNDLDTRTLTSFPRKESLVDTQNQWSPGSSGEVANAPLYFDSGCCKDTQRLAEMYNIAEGTDCTAKQTSPKEINNAATGRQYKCMKAYMQKQDLTNLNHSSKLRLSPATSDSQEEGTPRVAHDLEQEDFGEKERDCDKLFNVLKEITSTTVDSTMKSMRAEPMESFVNVRTPEPVDDKVNVESFSPLQLLQRLAEVHERHLRIARRAIAAVRTIKYDGWIGPCSTVKNTKRTWHTSPLRIPGLEESPLYIVQAQTTRCCNKLLPPELVYQLCDAVVSVLRDEPKHLRLYPPLHVISSILVNNESTALYSLHPRIEQLMSTPEKNGESPRQKGTHVKHLVVLGSLLVSTDIHECLELIVYMLALKLMYPNALTLLRGPFDDFFVSVTFGLVKDCIHRYGVVEGKELHRRVIDVLEFLPLCCTVFGSAEKILCASGDVPNASTDEALQRISSHSPAVPIPSLVIATFHQDAVVSRLAHSLNHEDDLPHYLALLWSLELMAIFLNRAEGEFIDATYSISPTYKPENDGRSKNVLFPMRESLKALRLTPSSRQQCLRGLGFTRVIRLLPSHSAQYLLYVESAAPGIENCDGGTVFISENAGRLSLCVENHGDSSRLDVIRPSS